MFYRQSAWPSHLDKFINMGTERGRVKRCAIMQLPEQRLGVHLNNSEADWRKDRDCRITSVT